MILPAAELDLLTGRMGWCFFTTVMPNPDPTFQNIAVETTAHRIRLCFSTGDETTCHRRATQKLPLSPAFFQRLKPAPWLLPSTSQQGVFTQKKWRPAGPSSVNPWEDSSRAGRIWKYANGLVWQQPLHATFKVTGSGCVLERMTSWQTTWNSNRCARESDRISHQSHMVKFKMKFLYTCMCSMHVCIYTLCLLVMGRGLPILSLCV